MEALVLTDGHQYLLNGVPFNGPSVTEVLNKMNMMGYLPNDQYFLDRGTYVHEAIALYLRGQLDESSLSEGIRPFVDSAIEYITATGYKATHIELPLHDPIYQYCGTLDALPLRDWKNSSNQAWHSIQLAAYYHLAVVNNLKPEIPCSIHLSDKGKLPKVEPYKLEKIYADKKIFLAALACYQWRRTNKLIKEKAS